MVATLRGYGSGFVFGEPRHRSLLPILSTCNTAGEEIVNRGHHESSAVNCWIVLDLAMVGTDAVWDLCRASYMYGCDFCALGVVGSGVCFGEA